MEEIYKKHSNLVYKYLYSLCNDSNLAEELTQETFYKAIKAIDKFHNECKISTWLCKIAKNIWIDYLKNKRNTISIDEDNFMENLIADNTFENKIEDKSDIMQLYKLIHKLDDNTREVFYLRINGELSFKEIGEIMNRSEEWARIVFYRGKIKIKEMVLDDKK